MDGTSNVMNSAAMDSASDASPKGFVPTILLCFFLGAFGIHRFYMGKWITGVLYLVSLGLFGFGILYDFWIPKMPRNVSSTHARV